jgi:hypothetical protein
VEWVVFVRVVQLVQEVELVLVREAEPLPLLQEQYQYLELLTQVMVVEIIY